MFLETRGLSRSFWKVKGHFKSILKSPISSYNCQRDWHEIFRNIHTDCYRQYMQYIKYGPLESTQEWKICWISQKLLISPPLNQYTFLFLMSKSAQGSTLTLVRLSDTNRKTIRTSEYCWVLVRLDKCFCYKESPSNRKDYREFQVRQKLYIFIKQTQ
jgi:hypothetical protein